MLHISATFSEFGNTGVTKRARRYKAVTYFHYTNIGVGLQYTRIVRSYNVVSSSLTIAADIWIVS